MLNKIIPEGLATFSGQPLQLKSVPRMLETGQSAKIGEAFITKQAGEPTGIVPDREGLALYRIPPTYYGLQVTKECLTRKLWQREEVYHTVWCWLVYT